jgi:hypothetical protein
MATAGATPRAQRPGSRAGIVSTMRFPAFGADAVRSFVRYHASVGFARMYLFFDDPFDRAADVAAASLDGFRFEGAELECAVVVVRHDAALRARWSRCPSYARLRLFVDTEVQARQHLNCEVAMDMALSAAAAAAASEEEEEEEEREQEREQEQEQEQERNAEGEDDSLGVSGRKPGMTMPGIDWLLHIDSDELFHISEGSVRDHFADLYRDDVWQMTYLNHEGVPEEAAAAEEKEKEEEEEGGVSAGNDDGAEVPSTHDYFANITLFRRHHLDVPMSRGAQEGMQYWESRTTHGQYMLCYDNGKSAVRVVKGARPLSVHSWILPDPKEMPSKTALVDPRALDLSRVRRCNDPCILHFVVCGLPWLKAKYEMLGAFEDAWFGGKLPIAPSFHLDARDAFLAAGEDEGHDDGVGGGGGATQDNGGRIDALWRKQVVFRDVAVRERQLKAGVLLRFERPQRILRGEMKEEMVVEEDIEEEEVMLMEGDEKTSVPAPAFILEGNAGMMAVAAALYANGGGAALKNLGAAAAAPDAGAPTGDSAAVNSTAAATVSPPPPPQFTYDKAWILSNAVQNFL